MPRTTTVQTTGFKELEKNLFRLKSSTARSNMREAMREALEPMARAARQRAPVDTGALQEGITVTGRGNPPAPNRDDAEMMMGPGLHPQALFQEFGTYKEPPQPFMRPAWDGEKLATLDRFSVFAWDRVTRSLARVRG